MKLSNNYYSIIMDQIQMARGLEVQGITDPSSLPYCKFKLNKNNTVIWVANRKFRVIGVVYLPIQSSSWQPLIWRFSELPYIRQA